MDEPHATTIPGATATRERALGPDLTRGVMLWCIALANSHYFLDAPRVLGGYPRDGGSVDRAVTWAISTFVDGRAFPLFGLLFGYGVAQVVRRQRARGRKGVRRLLRRRAAALVAIGFCHALLLYVGDILAAYGVLLALGAWAVWWRDRWLLVWAAVFFVLTALPDGASLSQSSIGPSAAELPPDPWTAIVERLPVQPVIMLLGPIGFACPFLLGLWAGRRRILERPARHRRMLRVVAVIGIGAGVLGAQQVALVLSGAHAVPGEDAFAAAQALHAATGVFAGAGYAAAIALLSVRLASSPGRGVRALAATGQRSLTCYLAQSVVWTIAFTPFLLDLAGTATVATTALLATATWLATVALSDAMARAGDRGPFEVLLRRATYGRPRRAGARAGPAAAGPAPSRADLAAGDPPDPDEQRHEHPDGEGRAGVRPLRRAQDLLVHRAEGARRVDPRSDVGEEGQRDHRRP